LSPIFNIVPKILLQLHQPSECVIEFDLAQMFVVSLSGFIVITHHADIVADKRKPVLDANTLRPNHSKNSAPLRLCANKKPLSYTRRRVH
jgi:hypothetical protein